MLQEHFTATAALIARVLENPPDDRWNAHA
jgi:hypothetical protein